jgi:hypothetical protein
LIAMGNTKTQEVEWASEVGERFDYSTGTFCLGSSIRYDAMRRVRQRGSNIPEGVLYQGELK